MRRAFSLFGLLVSILTLGCSEKSDRVDVYPVHGKVQVNGQPAGGARVVFYPKAADVDGIPMPAPSANTNAEGVYRLESYEMEDGAPAGDYSVTVVWLEPPPPNADDLGVYDQKDRLKNRYGDPARSGLTATVKEGGGEIPPFDLK
jgi:hypothetical protein